MLIKSSNSINTKYCMLVLGMHRSGTSALAGSYHSLGYKIGKNKMPIDPEQNAKGFFENYEFYLLNENILSDNNLSWDTDQKIAIDELPTNKLAFYKKSIKRIIGSEFDLTETKILIKDPRICLLLPIYVEALEEMGYHVCVTIIYRNPIQIHNSLYKRNNFEIEKSYRITTNYLLQAEYHSRRLNRFFISFSDLLNHPEKLISGVQSHLKLEIDQDLKEVNQFLDSSLKHHTSEGNIEKSDFETVNKIFSILKDQSSKPFNNLQLLFDKLRMDFYVHDTYDAESVSNTSEDTSIPGTNAFGDNLYAQVFTDTGKGFNQDESYSQNIDLATEYLRFDLQTDSPILRLRIDPCNMACELIIEEIRLGNESETNIINHFTTNANIERSPVHLVFRHIDPQIVLSDLKLQNVSLLEIKFKILSLGDVASKEPDAVDLEKNRETEFGIETLPSFVDKAFEDYLNRTQQLEQKIEEANIQKASLLAKATRFETLHEVQSAEITQLRNRIASGLARHEELVSSHKNQLEQLAAQHQLVLKSREEELRTLFEQKEQGLVDSLNTKNNNLHIQLIELEDARKDELDVLEKCLEEKENELDSLRADSESIQKKVSAELENYKLKRVQYKSEIQNLNLRIQDLEKDNASANERFEASRLEIIALKSAKSQEIVDALEEKQNAITKLNSLYNKQKTEFAKIEKSLSRKEDENAILLQKSQENVNHVEQLGLQLKDVNLKKSLLEQKNKTVQLSLSTAEKKVDSLHLDIDNLRAHDQKMQAIFTTYQVEIEKRGDLIDDIKDSISYKLGRTITFPARLVSDLLRSEKYADTYSTGKFMLSVKMIFIAILNPVSSLKNLNREKIRVLRNAIQTESSGQILSNYKNLIHNSSSKDNQQIIISESDVSLLEANPHRVKLDKDENYEYSTQEDDVTSSNEENFEKEQTFFKVHCDNIISSKYSVELHGWAISENGIDGIEIFTDGIKQGETSVGLQRPDVRNHYPDILGSDAAGFKFLFNKSSTDCGKIEIRVKDKKGHILKIFKEDNYLDLGQQYEKYLEVEKEKMKNVKIPSLSMLEFKPVFGIFLIVDDLPKIYIERTISSLRNQAYKSFKITIFSRSINKDTVEGYKTKYPILFKGSTTIYLDKFNDYVSLLNDQITSQEFSWYMLIEAGDEISPLMLMDKVRVLNQYRETQIIYSDQDEVSMSSKRMNPHFKPCMNPDLLWSTNYIGSAFSFSKRLFMTLKGFNTTFPNHFRYYFLLNAFDTTKNVQHISKVLYHERKYLKTQISAVEEFEVLKNYLKETNIKGEVTPGLSAGTYRLQRFLIDKKKVSIVIPFKDDVETLKTCLDSIKEKTSYENYELILISNNSTAKETFEYLDELRRDEKYKIFEFNVPFNYSRICNYGVTKASGELILLLNNDVEVISKSWLTSMVEHIEREEVGAVGAKLLYHDNTVQHAGVILNLSGLAAHGHKYYPEGDSGYEGRINTIQNFSICTAACLLIEKSIFNKVGGLDEENFAVSFNDVDLCLKIREEGLLIVYTPYTKLYHYESKSRGSEDTPEKKERERKEISFFREKWKVELNQGDPFYNKNLTLRKKDFSINVDF